MVSFWLILWVFLFTRSHTRRLHPKVLPNGRPYKLYICGTFHQYSICGCEIKNFQSLLHWFSIHEIDPFCFLAHISHISFDLAESLTRGSQIRQTHCLRILQNFEIWLKWNTLKVYGFGSFWGPTYCRKTKDFAKTQKFWKTASFRI